MVVLKSFKEDVVIDINIAKCMRRRGKQTKEIRSHDVSGKVKTPQKNTELIDRKMYMNMGEAIGYDIM